MLLAACLLALAPGADPVGELRVIESAATTNPPSQWLTRALKAEALASIDRRREAFERIQTADDARAWQRRLRQVFLDALGGMPERTPLNSRITGRLQGEGFRVEKVMFESQPNHHVTATLYLPESQPPYPAVLIACGHSYTGKAAQDYQRMGMLFARNGLAAISYDPIGQGERYQAIDADGRPGHHTKEKPNARLVEVQRLTPRASIPYNPVEEHTLLGIGSVLLGTNTARYRIWDAMRVIDYLETRPEIDAKRIGVTGNSGGGTESSYLMALDERIACGAPGCYLMTFRRLLENSCPQDAEQNLFGQLAAGLDEADYVNLTAPRPALILAATRDVTFEITSTWELFREAKRFYARLDHPERVDLVETDAPHGFTTQLRLGAMRWMRRWLLGKDDVMTELEPPVFTPAQLQCTPEGQVLRLPGERSVYDLNLEWERRLAAQRNMSDAAGTQAQLRSRVARRIGVDLDATPVLRRANVREPLSRSGYEIHRYTLDGGFIPLPVLDFRPRQQTGDTVVYVHAEGKHQAAEPGGEVERLVQSGRRVVAVDLPGIGETLAARSPRDWSGELFGRNVPEFYLAYLNGRSLVGIRTGELLAVVRSLIEAKSPARVALISNGSAAGIPSLHAAALKPDLFSSVTLRRTLASWREVLAEKVPEDQLTNTVHGVLADYDLPDLKPLAGSIVIENR